MFQKRSTDQFVKTRMARCVLTNICHFTAFKVEQDHAVRPSRLSKERSPLIELVHDFSNDFKRGKQRMPFAVQPIFSG